MLLIPMVLKQSLQPAASQTPLLHPFVPLGKHTQSSLQSSWLPSMCRGNRAPLPEESKRLFTTGISTTNLKKGCKSYYDLLVKISEEELSNWKQFILNESYCLHTPLAKSLCPVPVKCVLEFETAMWMNTWWNTKISCESSAPPN